MEHRGTFYSVEFGQYGWAVWVGTQKVCDGFDTRHQAQEWVKSQ